MSPSGIKIRALGLVGLIGMGVATLTMSLVTDLAQVDAVMTLISAGALLAFALDKIGFIASFLTFLAGLIYVCATCLPGSPDSVPPLAMAAVVFLRAVAFVFALIAVGQGQAPHQHVRDIAVRTRQLLRKSQLMWAVLYVLFVYAASLFVLGLLLGIPTPW